MYVKIQMELPQRILLQQRVLRGQNIVLREMMHMATRIRSGRMIVHNRNQIEIMYTFPQKIINANGPL